MLCFLYVLKFLCSTPLHPPLPYSGPITLRSADNNLLWEPTAPLLALSTFEPGFSHKKPTLRAD